jgi:hypothetical protein
MVWIVSSAVAYILARTILIVLDFRSLFYLPAGAILSIWSSKSRMYEGYDLESVIHLLSRNSFYIMLYGTIYGLETDDAIQ